MRRQIDLGIELVSPAEISRLNREYLGHTGPTDVITFNYSDAGLHGEIFICVKVAVDQAAQWRTSWPAELVRYLVHGVLHLQGYNDATAAQRRRMKRVEDQLVEQLHTRFKFRKLEGGLTRRITQAPPNPSPGRYRVDKKESSGI